MDAKHKKRAIGPQDTDEFVLEDVSGKTTPRGLPKKKP